jgi:hypothetical protein
VEAAGYLVEGECETVEAESRQRAEGEGRKQAKQLVIAARGANFPGLAIIPDNILPILRIRVVNRSRFSCDIYPQSKGNPTIPEFQLPSSESASY